MQFTNAALSERFGLRDWDDYYDGLVKLAQGGMPIYFEEQVPTPAPGECLDVLVVDRSGHVGRAKVMAPVEVDVDAIKVQVATRDEETILAVADLPLPAEGSTVIRRLDDATAIPVSEQAVLFSLDGTSAEHSAVIPVAARLAAHYGLGGKLDLFVFHRPLSQMFGPLDPPTNDRGEPIASGRYLLMPSAPVVWPEV